MGLCARSIAKEVSVANVLGGHSELMVVMSSKMVVTLQDDDQLAVDKELEVSVAKGTCMDKTQQLVPHLIQLYYYFHCRVVEVYDWLLGYLLIVLHNQDIGSLFVV